MKTRAKGTTKTAAEASESAKSVTPKVQLDPESTNPPHLFILPEDISSAARIITLENPRYTTEDRYLVCPDHGFYEFTRVAAPKTTPRSWLLSPSDLGSAKVPEDGTTEDMSAAKAYVTRTADLFIATPIDPLYILLPALAPEPKPNSSDPPKQLFLAGDDYFERITAVSPELSNFIRVQSLRTVLERRMAVVCDAVDAGDETMYRLDEEKLLQELLRKARKIITKGLPASMEEKLIRKALEAPMLSIKRDESSLSELAKEEDSGAVTPVTESSDTQTTVSTMDSAATSFSEASATATSFPEDNNVTPKVTQPQINAPDGVADLLRLQTAFLFICAAYIAPHITAVLKKALASPSSPIDFKPLETHLAHLAKLRQEAVAARSLGDYSRKRSMNEDDEALETRAEKKRKKDEEEKRKKAGESRGVRDLKKVNVSGMKKMSDFFKKKA